MEITVLRRLRSLLFLERLEVLRTSENLGNHSIGPIVFCSVDHYRQSVWKDYWSRHETYVFGGKRSGAALIDTRSLLTKNGRSLNRKSINGDPSAMKQRSSSVRLGENRIGRL